VNILKKKEEHSLTAHWDSSHITITFAIKKNMEKIILTWDADKQMYSVRFATAEDKVILAEINALMDSLKRFYYEVIDEAATYNMSIDLFIDNECYYAWQDSCNKAKRVDELATKIGISFDTNRWVHTWF